MEITNVGLVLPFFLCHWGIYNEEFVILIPIWYGYLRVYLYLIPFGSI